MESRTQDLIDILHIFRDLEDVGTTEERETVEDIEDLFASPVSEVDRLRKALEKIVGLADVEDMGTSLADAVHIATEALNHHP